MSHAYQAVGWNPFKRRYDLIVAGAVVAFVAAFVGVSLALFPDATLEIMLIRATGIAGFVLLHVILCIGPLARLNPVFLPILYNRRHLGVTMFVVALAHAALVVGTYHVGSNINPIVSIFVSDAGLERGSFPFQALGFLALVILFLMAATSHDFWLSVMTAPVWKALHMLVYVAYALLVAHVALGALQAEVSPMIAIVTAAGFVVVLGLQLISSGREARVDRMVVGPVGDADSCPREPQPGGCGPNESAQFVYDGFIDACAVSEIPEKRARVVMLSGERVAIFRYDGKVSAVSSVCQHQNGPLGEGRIVAGCITCPWHGYQYQPDTGASPPPFVERVPTFRVRVHDGRVWVHPRPNQAGVRVEPAVVTS